MAHTHEYDCRVCGAHLDSQQDLDRHNREQHHQQNPPFTKTGGMAAPKFGSAGSGGAEYEPGPERD